MRTAAGRTKGSAQTVRGPNSSRASKRAMRPVNTEARCTPLRSSSRPPKARRSAESWLPLMAHTGSRCWQRAVRKSSHRFTAPTLGTPLS